MKRSYRLFILIILGVSFSCQNEKEEDVTKPTSESSNIVEMSNDINRVEPPHWWTGFKDNTLQLLVHHPNIGNAEASLSYNGVSLIEQHTARSENYLFLDLEIGETARPGQFNINFKFDDGEELFQTYELKSREKSSEEYVGFNSSDVIYLITPDRFANANPNNDSVEGLLETEVDRTNDYARHGGDIEGIINHVDYIKDMGFTAIWSCPLLTNDMPRSSYHGYAITDYYQVDPRFGANQDYKNLVQKASESGLKVVMDQVVNHCGLEHWWMKDLPFEDWVNHQQLYEANKDNWNNDIVTRSNHRRTSNQDLYASEQDKSGMADGWFVSTMPDLNQRNPFMAKYLIQNSIWWIEEYNLGGIRQDTYPYPDKAFMSDWAGAIMNEYPNFNIVGEEWSYNPLLISYWQKGSHNKDGYDSNLRSTMDFAMHKNVIDALNEEESWDKGFVKMYEGLANDMIYPTPKDILVFPDNHDMSRVHTQLKGNVENTKMALGYYLVMPRTVQIYYGTEILMNDFEKPGDHGLVRTDFPGGWEGDEVNAFTGEGLTEDQLGMQNYLKTLLNYRKTSKAIHDGKTVHFAPNNGIYAIFRMHDDEIVAVILNKTDVTSLDTETYSEIGLDGLKVKDLVTDKASIWSEAIEVNPNGITFLTTKF